MLRFMAGATGPVEDEGHAQAHDLRPQHVVFAGMDVTPVARHGQHHHGDVALLVHGAAGLGGGQLRVVQRDDGGGPEPRRVPGAIRRQPVVEGGAAGGRVRRLQIVDGDHHVREGTVDDADVDAFPVHGVESRLGVVPALQNGLVQGILVGVEELLRADHGLGGRPRGDHLALYIPVRHVGRTPAQVTGPLVAVGAGEVGLVHVLHLDDVEIAVHHPEAVFHGVSLPFLPGFPGMARTGS